MDVASILKDPGISIGTLTVTTVARTLVTLIVGAVLIKVVLRFAAAWLNRANKVSRFKGQILSAIRTALYFLLLLIVFDSLGVKVTSFVALMSVAALAVSLALQTTLSNIAGGITSAATQPFALGDYVSVNNVEGSVAEMALSSTKLRTLDNKEIIIPNAQIANAIVINFTRQGTRRMDIAVTASYEAPTQAVYAALREAMERHPQILQEPAPETHITEYGTSSIGYIARFWVPAADYWTVWFGMLETVRETFASHGVEMTYDHLNVHFDKAP